ncbi:MAG: glycosyltransferase family 87 protein [Candidatus Binatia bacterium]
MPVAYRMAASPLSVEKGHGSRIGRATVSLALIAFLALVSLVSYRGIGNLNVPGHPDASHWVLQDFRDTVYFPAVAFLEGRNPYDAGTFVDQYPVWRPLPLYLPVNLLIHLPFGFLPFESAELAYYVLTLLLTIALAYLSLRLCGLPARLSHVFGLAALIVLSRPGHMNLLLGQVTLQCVIATYVALHYARSRSWLAGLGLAVSTFKPTFGIPLAVLMLCRRDMRAVVTGVVLAAMLSGAVAGILAHAAGGVEPLVASMLTSHQGFADQQFNDPVFGPFRIDTPALVARLLGANPGALAEVAIGLAVLSIGAFGVWRVAGNKGEETGLRPLSATLICITMLACTYHQTYDWLLLTLPLTALAADRWVPRHSTQPALRWLLLGVLSLPALNYLATATAIDRLGLQTGWRLVVTSLNAGVLLIAFAAYVALALHSQPVSTARPVRS